MTVIHVENVSKVFKTPVRGAGLRGAFRHLIRPRYREHTAVRDVSFTIPSGEIVGYIGANGAGKSTTIKMLTGILTPTSGRCTVGGLVPYEERTRNAQQIGVVFGQRTQLWWDLPFGETLAVLKEMYEIPASDFTGRLKELTAILGLEPFMNQAVRTLSLGQRMRADLAAALLHNPKVLFLDEPTIGLDVLVKERMRGAIHKINRDFGTTVILTTHDLQDIEELCSRVIMIDKGAILFDGRLANLRSRFGAHKILRFQGSFDPVVPGDVGIPCRITQSEGLLEIEISDEGDGAARVMHHIFTRHGVRNFEICESSLEDVVKRLYLGEDLHAPS